MAGELLGADEQCGKCGFVEAFEDEDLGAEDPRRLRAAAKTFRRSATPEKVADTGSKDRSLPCARRRAMVVFPTPGGCHRMAEVRRCRATMRPRGPPGPGGGPARRRLPAVWGQGGRRVAGRAPRRRVAGSLRSVPSVSRVGGGRVRTWRALHGTPTSEGSAARGEARGAHRAPGRSRRGSRSATRS